MFALVTMISQISVHVYACPVMSVFFGRAAAKSLFDPMICLAAVFCYTPVGRHFLLTDLICSLQRMCRRLLALYNLPSWGRCELALSLLQEPDITYTLEDVVQAVKESHNRDFIRRLLNNECPCCLSIFPCSKVGLSLMWTLLCVLV